jgi:hypothetical protein
MPNYALVYDGPSNGSLLAYADSDWASDPNTRKSTSGYVVKLAGAIFSWNMHVQETIVLSSTKAEYMSLSDTSRQLVWVRNLFSELSIELAPIPLFGDNQGSIFIASNPVQEKHSKHIDLRYHYIRDVVSRPGCRDRVIRLIFTCRTTRLLLVPYDIMSSFLLMIVARYFFTLPAPSPSFLSFPSPSGTFHSRLLNVLLPSGSFCTLPTCSR